jgi:hypothetical protein
MRQNVPAFSHHHRFFLTCFFLFSQKINKLENALLINGRGSSDSETPKDRANSAIQEVDEILRDSFSDLAINMSASRVAEYLNYTTSSEDFLMPQVREITGWDGKEKRKSLHKYKYPDKIPGQDSVDALFPDFPDPNKGISPDKDKGKNL